MQLGTAQPTGISLAILILVGVTACNTRDYTGDGELVDNGTLAASHRYVLSLGELNDGEALFKISGLPNEEFTFGLEVSGPASVENLCESRPIKTIVKMELLSPTKTVEFGASIPLNEWVWSCRADILYRSFVYLRGETANSTALLRQSGVYSLNVRFEHQVPQGFVVNVVAQGGGWK